jgi:hypothetical protein
MSSFLLPNQFYAEFLQQNRVGYSCIIILENLIVALLLKKITVLYGIRSANIFFTGADHWSIYQAN